MVLSKTNTSIFNSLYNHLIESQTYSYARPPTFLIEGKRLKFSTNVFRSVCRIMISLKLPCCYSETIAFLSSANPHSSFLFLTFDDSTFFLSMWQFWNRGVHLLSRLCFNVKLFLLIHVRDSWIRPRLFSGLKGSPLSQLDHMDCTSPDSGVIRGYPNRSINTGMF